MADDKNHHTCDTQDESQKSPTDNHNQDPPEEYFCNKYSDMPLYDNNQHTPLRIKDN
jgi:hypothetical protein